MFTKKTRVIIATILLIAALALALRGRIIWEEITQWIAVQSLPLITSQSEPLEQPKQQLSDHQPLLLPAHTTPHTAPNFQASTTIITSDEPQIIPTPEIVHAAFEHTKNELAVPAPKKPRVARRRRKKETEHITTHEQQLVAMTEIKQSEPATTQPVFAPTELRQAAPISDATPVYAAPQLRQATKKTIRICNKIDANKLGVKHWTGTYSPTKLEITLNNVPFVIVGDNPTALETLQEIPCADNRITVCYLYEFLNGMRKGSDTVIYTFTDATQLEMHFSWDTPWHVELSGAQRIE